MFSVRQRLASFSIYWVMLALAVLVSAPLIVLYLYQGYERLAVEEGARLLSQGRVIRQNLVYQLESTDRVLQLVRARRLGFPDAPLSSHDLIMLSGGTQGVNALFVVDADGVVRHSSQEALLGKDMDEDSFVQRIRRANNPGQLYIASPQRLANASVHMRLARTLADQEGNFAGIVIAALNPAYFSTLLASVNYTPDMWSAIAHEDGTLFLREPAQRGISAGSRVAAKDAFLPQRKLDGQMEEVVIGRGSPAEGERQTAVLAIRSDLLAQDSTLYVLASRELKALYAPWYREVRLLTFSYVLILALLVFGIRAYLRRQARQQAMLLRAERELQASAGRLKLAAEAVGLGFWEYEPDSGRSLWDGNMFRIYGVNPENFDEFSDHWRQSVLPDDIEPTNRVLEQAMQGLCPYDVQFRIQRRDSGEIRTIRSWGHVFRSAEGVPVRLVGINEDVTERVSAEERLAQRERDLKAILDNLPSLVSYWDVDLRNRFGNQAYLDWFGIDPATMPGMHLSELLTPERYRELRPYIEAALRGDPQTFEQRIQAKGAQTRHILSHYIPDLRDGIVRGAYVMVSDISEIKRAEDKLRLAASVFANTQDGIIVTGEDNVVVDVNPAFTRITGYTRDEAIGLNPKIFSSDRQGADFYAEMWRSLRENGHWRGELWNRRKSGEEYVELLSVAAVRGSDGAIMHYVGVFSDITRYKDYEAELSRMAHFDPLTSLPNRRMLADRLGQAIARARRSGHMLAVCYLDLDGFKPINDRFGHGAGDRVLLEVSRRLQEALRADDTVARLGGDEFVLLLNGIEHPDECLLVLRRVLDAVTGTRLEDVPLSVSASIGVSLFPQDDADADALLRHADQAMYHAKDAGRNRYHFFDPDHDKQLRAQREALGRLYEALLADEFCLYYQPKVNLVSAEVIGAEALIRWRHPERGLVAPGEFLPLMEGSELEIQVGEWVIETALRQIESWKEQGLNLSVSANVSPEHLRHPGFIEMLRQALLRHPGVSPGDLELEILESAAIGDIEQASRVLTAGTAMGVRFALDDFGTGYSSLTYFRRLPIGTLKIDQTFVRDMLVDPDDLGIVDSVVRLAEAFDRPSIAEGVETREHGAMLVQLGCHLAQGYGIARPMPPEQIPVWLEGWQREGGWSTMETHALRHADVALLAAAHSERAWYAEVIDSIYQGEGARGHALAANACRFGRWWQGSAQRRYGTQADFLRLGEIHQAGHALAQELLELARRGQVEAASDRLPELDDIQQAFFAAIDTFSSRIHHGLTEQGTQLC